MGKSEVGIPDREHGLPWFRLRHWRTWDWTGYGGAGLLEEEPRACPQSPGRSTDPQGTAAQVCDSADRCSTKVTVTGDSDKLGLFCIFSLNFSEAVLLWARGNRPLELNCLSPRIDLEVWLPGDVGTDLEERPPGRHREPPFYFILEPVGRPGRCS